MSDLLTRTEINDAIAHLGRPSRTREPRRQAWRNERTLFELVTCCGMTATVIADLRVGQVKSGRGENPRRWIAFNPGSLARSRIIPLHWLAIVEDHIAEHVRFRREQMQADDHSPLLCRLRDRAAGKPLDRAQIHHTYAAACVEAAIARDRARISIGVASFAMNAITSGIESVQVRAVMGALALGEDAPKLSPLSPMYEDVLRPKGLVC